MMAFLPVKCRLLSLFQAHPAHGVAGDGSAGIDGHRTAR
jgi:hypothetical protein